MSRQRVLRSKFRRLIPAVAEQGAIILHLLHRMEVWPASCPHGRWRLLRHNDPLCIGEGGIFVNGHFTESSRGLLFEIEGGAWHITQDEFSPGIDVFVRFEVPSIHNLREDHIDTRRVLAGLDDSVASIILATRTRSIDG